mmetsp:Transcript_12524/g.19704  ORF Transcript_12524/g.19704 Transcript_12524/m.19704 type:complete len:220 (+) Transcript_12524:3-662(+)
MTELYDKDGQPLPMFSDEYWRRQMLKYSKLHHRQPGELVEQAYVTSKENLFFRQPRETPGWMPGGRFLNLPGSQAAIDDMQEREQYTARKARVEARNLAKKQRAALLEREKKLTRGPEPKRYMRMVERARQVRTENQERAQDGNSKGVEAPTREKLEEENRRMLEQEIERFAASRKGRRIKNMDSLMSNRILTIRKMREVKRVNPMEGDKLKIYGEPFK